MRNNCEKCGSDDIFFYAQMIVKGTGSMNKDGTIDEFSDCEKILKYKIISYSCLNCQHESE